MKAFRHLALMQFRLFLREPSAFFFTLVFPTLLLVLYGVIFGNDPDRMSVSGRGYIDIALPALVGLVAVNVGLMGVPIETATARDQKVLRRFRSTPISPFVWLGSTVAVYYVVSMLGIGLLLIVAETVFDLRMQGSFALFFLAASLVTMTFLACGFVVAAMAKTARIAQVVGMVLFFPMMFLSGAAIPRFVFPEGLRRFSDQLPLTRAVDVLQKVAWGEGLSGATTSLVIVVALFVISVITAVVTFRWE